MAIADIAIQIVTKGADLAKNQLNKLATGKNQLESTANHNRNVTKTLTQFDLKLVKLKC